MIETIHVVLSFLPSLAYDSFGDYGKMYSANHVDPTA